ncbi:MAG: phosphate ABC transporter permease PstA [Planctomycetes bacterium]|nr:phosphate ABC transporter permease PstA [Planctomycetota bacterium]
MPTSAPPRPLLRRVTDPQQSMRARGEPMLWLCGGALAMCLLMVVGLLTFVTARGLGTFWPTAAVQLRLPDGTLRLGEITRESTFTPSAEQIAGLGDAEKAVALPFLHSRDGVSVRHLIRTGNTGDQFFWVPDYLVVEQTTPEWALVVEREATVDRQSWGRFYGFPTELRIDGATVADTPAATMARFAVEHDANRARVDAARSIRKQQLGALSTREEEARLYARRMELRHGADSPEHRAALAAIATVAQANVEPRERLNAELARLEAENTRYQMRFRTADGTVQDLYLADIVRLYPANQLSLTGKLAVFWDRWIEFLTAEPRESNQEGGVWPAIFGTVLMTLIMSLLVVPLGVLAALYIREYARAGLVISAVRVAVNNLAGVPSIVFGVFGLGFFCYLTGGSIDALFYPERLPNPTFGKAALVWASLTLALLTLPVVIVATEEALAAVPSSMREGSYACGASKWQTIRRIVLPRAMPGIMTGTILAMARGAGEVAPLMLVGAAKWVPELPFDGEAPYLHPSRSFMHLGFHIYDLGFQSQNSEAAKPMVFTTTLLLIGVIMVLNVTAVFLRSRLRRRFVAAQF